MADRSDTTYFNMDQEIRIEVLPAGGFIISQSYYDKTQKTDDGRDMFVSYKKAFSTAGDLISYLDEALGYPIRPRISTSNVHPLPT